MSNTFKNKLKDNKFMMVFSIDGVLNLKDDVIFKPYIQNKDYIDAILINSFPDSISLSSHVLSRAFKDRGFNPIVTITTREQNRVNIISTLLGLYTSGVRDILITGGYHQNRGNEPGSRGVYDIDPVQLIGMVSEMNATGEIYGGVELEERPDFNTGAVANFTSEPSELFISNLKKKVQSGADFFLTQPVFNIEPLTAWLTQIEDDDDLCGIKIIATVMPVNSHRKLSELQVEYPEFAIPDELIHRMKNSDNPSIEGLTVVNELIENIKKLDRINGIHIQSRYWRESISEIVSTIKGI